MGELTGNIGIPLQIHLLGPGEIGYNLLRLNDFGNFGEVMALQDKLNLNRPHVPRGKGKLTSSCFAQCRTPQPMTRTIGDPQNWTP